MTPEVSVITPVYNSEKFLEESVSSVLSQHYESFELLPVDDVSSDASADLIQKFSANDSRIRPVFLKHHLGPAGARNTGIQNARGRFIAFLDSDDVWLPEKLKLQLQFMKETGAAVSFTAYRKMDPSGKLGGIVRVPEEVNYRQLLKTNHIGMLTAVYDRKRVGTRMLPDILKRQDYALWLDILREGHVARGLNRVLAYHRIHGNSISRNKMDAARYQWRVYRELEGLGRIKSAWYFAHYAVHGVFKHR